MKGFAAVIVAGLSFGRNRGVAYVWNDNRCHTLETDTRVVPDIA
jgi:hypothetical protein